MTVEGEGFRLDQFSSVWREVGGVGFVWHCCAPAALDSGQESFDVADGSESVMRGLFSLIKSDFNGITAA